VQYDPMFEIRKPDAHEHQLQRVILVFQFCYIGAPYIYYGDEVGMWGADDPDCRKPMIWEEFTYEPEQTHPFDLSRPTDTVEIDHELLEYYKGIINLRKQYESLRHGEYQTVLTDDDQSLFAFERWTKDERIRAIFNLSNEIKEIPIASFLTDANQWKCIWGSSDQQYRLGPKSAKIFLKIKSSIHT